MSDDDAIRDTHPHRTTRKRPGVARATAGLRQRIATMGPGDTFPTVSALAREYDVSHPTLRRALEDLRALGLVQEEGLVERRDRKAGSGRVKSGG